MQPLDLRETDTLEEARRKAKMCDFGGTDCAQPLVYALDKGLKVNTCLPLVSSGLGFRVQSAERLPPLATPTAHPAPAALAPAMEEGLQKVPRPRPHPLKGLQDVEPVKTKGVSAMRGACCCGRLALAAGATRACGACVASQKQRSPRFTTLPVFLNPPS